MENVTPLWLTVARRPADVKACLLQTAGLLCYSSASGVSCFICNTQEVNLTSFFSTVFFIFFCERCTPLHYRGYPQREITHALLMSCCLPARRQRCVHFSDMLRPLGIFYSLESHVLCIFIPFSLFVSEDIWVSLSP